MAASHKLAVTADQKHFSVEQIKDLDLTFLREDLLTCPVHLGPMTDPQMTPCLHFIDRSSADGMKAHNQHSCPKCKKPGALDQLTPVNSLVNSLDDSFTKAEKLGKAITAQLKLKQETIEKQAKEIDPLKSQVDGLFQMLELQRKKLFGPNSDFTFKPSEIELAIIAQKKELAAMHVLLWQLKRNLLKQLLGNKYIAPTINRKKVRGSNRVLKGYITQLDLHFNKSDLLQNLIFFEEKERDSYYQQFLSYQFIYLQANVALAQVKLVKLKHRYNEDLKSIRETLTAIKQNPESTDLLLQGYKSKLNSVKNFHLIYAQALNERRSIASGAQGFLQKKLFPALNAFMRIIRLKKSMKENRKQLLNFYQLKRQLVMSALDREEARATAIFSKNDKSGNDKPKTISAAKDEKEDRVVKTVRPNPHAPLDPEVQKQLNLAFCRLVEAGEVIQAQQLYLNGAEVHSIMLTPNEGRDSKSMTTLQKVLQKNDAKMITALKSFGVFITPNIQASAPSAVSTAASAVPTMQFAITPSAPPRS